MSTTTIANIPGGQVTDGNLTSAAKFEVEDANGDTKWVPLSQLGTGLAVAAPWTPVLLFGGAATGMVFTAQGTYTRIGNLVTARCYIILSAKGSSTGAVAVAGLPLTSKNTSNQYQPVTVRLAGSGSVAAGAIQGYLAPNSTNIILDLIAAGGVASLTDANFSNTSELMVAVTYTV